MRSDLFHTLKFLRGVSPQAGAGDDTALVSQIIDTQGFDALLFAILLGTLADADATFTVLVEHGDAANLADAAAVPDTALLGTEALAGFKFDDDDKVKKIGYRGMKRYVRLTITPSNNTGTWGIGVLAILGVANDNPVS